MPLIPNASPAPPMAPTRPLRILFLWTDVSGYMAACWRELAGRPGVTLRVAAHDSSTQTAFDDAIMEGVDWVRLDGQRRFDVGFLRRQVEEFRPDAIAISGWHNSAYRRVASMSRAPGRRFIMAMDTPWRGTLKQHVGRFALRGYLSLFDVVMVTGERCWQYARRLGVPERNIRRGVYGIDHDGLSRMHDARAARSGWPRQFLFAGRYSHEKGIDLLLSAHAEYRRGVADPWPLVCCGKGTLAEAIRGHEGVRDLGFQQPAAVSQLMAESGAFVLPSTYDPWPLALVEACATGLPVVASGACGSAVELIRDGYSGFSFATGDRDSLVRTLRRVHDCTNIAEVGRRARLFAEPYGTRFWANNWLAASR